MWCSLRHWHALDVQSVHVSKQIKTKGNFCTAANASFPVQQLLQTALFGHTEVGLQELDWESFGANARRCSCVLQ